MEVFEIYAKEMHGEIRLTSEMKYDTENPETARELIEETRRAPAEVYKKFEPIVQEYLELEAVKPTKIIIAHMKKKEDGTWKFEWNEPAFDRYAESIPPSP